MYANFLNKYFRILINCELRGNFNKGTNPTIAINDHVLHI